MRSDNAKNFKSASKRLSRLFDIPGVQQFLAEKRVMWSFQLPRAPWWGGFFERLIKCAKRCLKKILGVLRVTYEELSTLIVEVEAILNSRPLTYVYPDDVEEPLTPSHLMAGRRLLSIPDDKISLEDEDKDDHSVLTRRERYLALLLGHFWRRWRKEYLLELREHHKMSVRRNNLPQISLGDIVTVMDDEGRLSRSQWKLGKIEELIKSDDGAIRGAKLRFSSKGRRSVQISRPLQKLFSLEVRHMEPVPENAVVTQPAGDVQRPKRKAAVTGELRRRLVDQCLDDDDDL